MLKSHLLMIIFLGSLLLTNSGCVGNKNDQSFADKEPAPRSTQKTAPTMALDLFETRQTFWSLVKKTKFHNKKFYSLVFTKTSAEAVPQSSLVVQTQNGVEEKFAQLPSNYTLIDFDITPTGHIVQLAFEETAQHVDDFALKELSVFVDSKKVFVFSDSKQNSAIIYNENGQTEMAKPFHSDHTYFLTSWSLTPFARILAADQEIFISATGTFGFKVFAFTYSGQEISQAEVLPQTIFNTVLVDREAPHMQLSDSRLVTTITTKNNDAPLFERHFGLPLEWHGAKFQAVVQSFDFSMKHRLVQLTDATANFFATGIETSKNEIAVFGSVGGPGDRKAALVLLDANLGKISHSEFTLENESSLTSATHDGIKWIVAGQTGFAQVQTASVVRPGDAFVCAVDSDGSSKTLVRFGTDRNSQVNSLVIVNSAIYASGILDGPITHTADTNRSLGYQKWFFGKLK